MERSRLTLNLTFDGDLYEAVRHPGGKWIITRYPQSPLFKPSVVELTKLPERLYDEFTTQFLRLARRDD
jgi:hypothetical protein